MNQVEGLAPSGFKSVRVVDPAPALPEPSEDSEDDWTAGFASGFGFLASSSRRGPPSGGILPVASTDNGRPVLEEHTLHYVIRLQRHTGTTSKHVLALPWAEDWRKPWSVRLRVNQQSSSAWIATLQLNEKCPVPACDEGPRFTEVTLSHLKRGYSFWNQYEGYYEADWPKVMKIVRSTGPVQIHTRLSYTKTIAKRDPSDFPPMWSSSDDSPGLSGTTSSAKRSLSPRPTCFRLPGGQAI